MQNHRWMFGVMRDTLLQRLWQTSCWRLMGTATASSISRLEAAGSKKHPETYHYHLVI